MKDENYIVIQGWMINNLKLKGNELTIYALIYGYSQDGDNRYRGNFGTIAEDTNISRPAVMKNINKLVEKNYIFMNKVTKDFYEYFIKPDIIKKVNDEKSTIKKVNDDVKKVNDTIKKINDDVKKVNGVHLINIYNNNLIIIYKYIINFLNEKAGTNFKFNIDKTKKKIKARLNEGFSIEDFERVIDIKVREWKGTDFEQYLRPETLFGTKFEGYLNQKEKKKKNEVPKKYRVDYLTPTEIVGDE